VKRDPTSFPEPCALLVNFLEHEVLEAAFFRLDGIPRYMLHLPNHRLAVEIGQLHTVRRYNRHIAIGEEEDVARVLK